MFHSNDKSSVSGGVSFSASERFALLSDFARIGLLLGKDFASPVLPLRKGSEIAETDAVSPLERMLRLSERWDAAQNLLPQTTARQDMALTQTAASIPIAQSRGGRSAASEIARRPQSASAWLTAANGNGGGAGTSRISELRPQTTKDTLANRFVATLLEQRRDEAFTLARLAEFCGETERAAQMRLIAEQAARWRNRPQWRELRPLTAAQCAAIPEHAARWPAAHRVLAQEWLSERNELRIDWKNSLRTDWPALESWRLYEMWCYLKVAEALRTAGWKTQSGQGTNESGSAIRVSTQGIALMLEKGRKSELNFKRGGETLTLTYQSLFPSAAQSRKMNEDSGRFVSRSHAMQPDICLNWRNRLYLLDPKFRAYDAPETNENADFARADSAMQDDINKMHAYRDAIVRDQIGVVAAAWCLFPGGADGSQNPVIAFPPAAPENPFGSAGIGAILLRPGHAAEILSCLLESWFAAAS